MARKSGKDRGIFERMKPCPKCNGNKDGCASCTKGMVGTGIWYVRWTDQYGRDHKRKIGPKALAKDVHSKIRTELVEGTYLPEKLAKRKRSLLRDAIKEYLKESRATKRSWKDDARFGAEWTRALGEVSLQDVRPADVERWRREKSDPTKPGSMPATVNRYVAFLKRVFNVAIRDGRCEKNPVSRIKMLTENNTRVRFMTAEEEAKLRAAFDPKGWHYVELALHTGLRASEQMNLRWEDVDFVNGVLTIPRSKHGEKRHVPMNVRVQELLRELPSRMKSPWVYPGRCENCKGSRQRCEACVTGEGRPLHVTTARTVYWTPAVKRSGIKNLRWHDMRHTFASRLVMKGVGLRTVQELMGHRTITVTERYAHLAPDHLASAVALLASSPLEASPESEQKRNKSDGQVTECETA